MTRESAISGQFYPGTKKELEDTIKGLIPKASGQRRTVNAIAVVSPHAGYLYSGAVAAEVFSSIRLTQSFVIMGPNHTGVGKPFSIQASGGWKTPLGEIKIDEELAEAILEKSAFIQRDPSAHAFEHSIEAQLPIMQYLKKDFSFVPLLLSNADLDTYKQIGNTIANAIKKVKKEVVIVASSDFTHYEAHDIAKAKDEKAIGAILKMDNKGLLDAISSFDISMCGYAPVVAAITAAKALGAKKAKLLKYQTSGEASGDYAAVVGYAGIIVS